MRTTVRTLRRLINKALNEAPVSLAGVESQGLALFILGTVYLLYDSNELIDSVKRALKKGNKNVTGEDIAACCYGMIDVSERKDAWDSSQVIASAARKGYGPFMYDLVMRDRGALIADRSSVSKTARNVWNTYKNSRDDVEAKPLDDRSNPRTPEKIDDTAKLYNDGDPGDPLNFAYVAKEAPMDVADLTRRHDQTLEALDRLGVSLGDKTFKSAAFFFFHENYVWGS